MKNNNTKLKKLGFTLIELLAIIVILAIIAVITVPIILNVIDNAKKGTAKDSAYGYKDAISKYYVSGMLEEEKINLNSTYNVVDGKLGEYDIPFSGTKPTSGYLTFENNILTTGCLTIDGYKVTFTNGEVENVIEGECELIPEQPVEPDTPQVTYKCKRANVEALHKEVCAATSGQCVAVGYTEDNMGKTITYGNTSVTEGILKSGDAFDCDVNGDGEYNSDTERFYYVSDLYNATSKEFNDDYAVLIYYNNFINGKPDNSSSSLVAYHPVLNLNGVNYNGPVTAKTYLPTTSQWVNVNLSNTTRAILNEKSEGTSDNGARTLPTGFSYEGYAARLLTTQEIEAACNITVGSYTTGKLDSCNYLIENTRFFNPLLATRGYWLENARSDTYHLTITITGEYRAFGSANTHLTDYYGVRPAIEVLKTDIQY